MQVNKALFSNIFAENYDLKKAENSDFTNSVFTKAKGDDDPYKKYEKYSDQAKDCGIKDFKAAVNYLEENFKGCTFKDVRQDKKNQVFTFIMTTPDGADIHVKYKNGELADNIGKCYERAAYAGMSGKTLADVLRRIKSANAYNDYTITDAAADKKNGIVSFTVMKGESGFKLFYNTDGKLDRREEITATTTQKTTSTSADSTHSAADSVPDNTRIQRSDSVPQQGNTAVPTYVDVTIMVNGKSKPIKIEKGCSFENNGAIYRINDDGLLSVYDKKQGKWITGKNQIDMTSYQYDTFRSVANNNPNELSGSVVLSKSDIDKALELFTQRKLRDDLSEFVNLSVYDVKDVISCSNNGAIGVYIKKSDNTTSQNSAVLIFKYGTASDALTISDFIHNNVVNDEDVGSSTDKVVQNSEYYTKKVKISDLKASSGAGTLIKNAEGLRLNAYKCPAGKWTIGYGHTGKVDGKKIHSGMSLNNKAKAEELLKKDMEEAAKIVRKYVKVDLTKAQFDALVSFVFNVGEGNFSNSTLLKELNKGHYKEAAKQITRWVYADGVEQPGLKKRRRAERDLFEGRA